MPTKRFLTGGSRKNSTEQAKQVKKRRGRPFKKLTPMMRAKQMAAEKASADVIYRCVETATPMGGNASFGPIYGELTKKSFQNILAVLVTKCFLTIYDVFIDVGCGRGKPNLHMSKYVLCSIGIEVVGLRTSLGNVSMERIMRHDPNLSNCILQTGDITSAHSLDPFTVVYGYDVGVSSMVKC